MKPNQIISSLLTRNLYLSVLAVWCLSIGASHALQLGKHRGAAVVGQALNITIQATASTPDELAAGCLEADVFYADNRVQKSRVRVTTEKVAGSAPDALIRIQSTLPVDEPIVTVYLRAGCQQKLEKRYVILADLASEPAASMPLQLPALPAQAGSAGSTGSGAQSASVAPLIKAEAREARRIEREARRAQRQAQAAAAAQPAASPGRPVEIKTFSASAKKAQAPEKQKSRLKLEPFDLLAERDPALRTSAELQSTPATDRAQRAAAAALWRAIAAQPEDILNDSQKLKTLESTVSSMQLQIKQNQQGMQALSDDVKKAQSERFANPFVYGAALLVFLAALGLVWLFRRRASPEKSDEAIQPWWRRSTSQRIGWADSALGEKSAGGTGPLRPGSGYSPSRAARAAATASFLDLDLSEAGNSGDAGDGGAGGASRFQSNGVVTAVRQEALVFKAAAGVQRKLKGQDATRKSRVGFAASDPLAARVIDAEELFDVHQQADFFVSLGQKDQAIDVLRLHIEESEHTSALVYLDLLSLYHQTKEELEFEAFRLEFNAKFNAEMPAFEDYLNEAVSDGLQGYPTAMSRIVALWPSPKVVTVIEESLFRQADSQNPTFDLEAYRELLLLYAMIKDLLHSQPSSKNKAEATVAASPLAAGPIGFGDVHDFQADVAMDHSQAFPSTSVVPLTATIDSYVGGRELGIDLDLSSSDDEFNPEKVALASASLPLDEGGAIDMLNISPARPSAESRSDSNAIDFDIEQFDQVSKPTAGKPTIKKTR